MSTIFQNYLKDFKVKEKIVSVYSDPDSMDKFSAGFVSECTEDMVLLKHVSPIGTYDGYAVIRLENISRIDSDGIYERKLELLYSTQKQKHPKRLIRKKVNSETNLFFETLKVAQEKAFLVNVSLDSNNNQESAIGYVKKLDKESLIIQQLSLSGVDDGETILHVYDIEKMYCDSEDDRALGVLNSFYKKK